MKKSFFKNSISTILVLCLVMLLASCSSDEKDPAIVFTSIEANKTDIYIDGTITLNIKASGYKDINVITSNTKIKITKVASTIYEISSTEATSAKIHVILSNNTYKDTKNIDLTFAEHGVKNYNTVEGIKVNADLSSKVLSLLGEPDIKTNSTDGLSEYWRYASKGLGIIIIKSSTIVDQIDMYSSNYFYTNSANAQVSYTNFPYEIGNGWKINSATTTMDMVVTLLGVPTIKSTSATSTTNRAYQYATQKLVFRFYSDTEDNYIGKKIIYLSVY
ncbi:hypothetical protein SAMN05443549_103278 [Flavobacterium fluvii]|uniref:Uncharacterized protein n=1 Tax=Flavobacterium fluvii TaxID=468056 RepID=A0A1M5IXG6_9FLAO|nr:hypothetical protein [Flavobacterium fluvii]SHG32961.1 hypothetical protein SAMN05443549_103278 [Flavobacterium fluvii]